MTGEKEAELVNEIVKVQEGEEIIETNILKHINFKRQQKSLLNHSMKSQIL